MRGRDKEAETSGEMSEDKVTNFRLILLFSDESLGAASSEGGVGEAGSFLAREGAMEDEGRGSEEVVESKRRERLASFGLKISLVRVGRRTVG